MTGRRDRTGEVIDQDDDTGCAGAGWLDRDECRPCAACRPWLALPHPRPPTSAELAAVKQRPICPGRTRTCA